MSFLTLKDMQHMFIISNKTNTCVHEHTLTHFNIFSSSLLNSTLLFFSSLLLFSAFFFSSLFSSLLFLSPFFSSLFLFLYTGVEFRFGCAVDDVIVSDEEEQSDKRITGTYVDRSDKNSV